MSIAEASLAAQYARIVGRRTLLLAALAAATLAAFVADLATGAAGLPLAEVLTGLVAPESLGRAARVVVWDIRLPAACMALAVGGALGLAGAEMQTALANPLASPFTLGVAHAAALGASLAIVWGFAVPGVGGAWTLPLAAFVFAMAATLLVQGLSARQGAGTQTVVLFGVALGFAANALMWLVQYMASADAVQQIVFWSMGSLARATWAHVGLVAAALGLCLPLALRRAWAMTALRAGEHHARALGIGVEGLRLAVLGRVSVLAAVAVAFVGTIGFVGLVAPHVARMLLGEDHRFLLPGSALAGALMLSLASLASKTLAPGTLLPVGIVTAIVGIPMFVGLLLAQGRRR